MSAPGKQSDLKRLATEDEAILYIMEKRDCDREEAEEFLERFYVECPQGWFEIGSC